MRYKYTVFSKSIYSAILVGMEEAFPRAKGEGYCCITEQGTWNSKRLYPIKYVNEL